MLSSAIAAVMTDALAGGRREARRRGLHGQLEGVQQAARVAVGDVDQVVQRVLVDARPGSAP